MLIEEVRSTKQRDSKGRFILKPISTPIQVETRADIAINLRKYGMQPYFYPESDVALFEKVLLAAGVKMDRLQYCRETLHTVFPPLNIKPDPERGGVYKYGLLRLGLPHFFCRPHIGNVVSCVVVGRSYCGMGQLGHLMNPCWACFAAYDDPNSKMRWGTPSHGDAQSNKMHGISADEFELPNLLGTYNVYRGFDAQGYPAAFICGANGSSTTVLYRLVRYLRCELGLRVYQRYYNGNSSSNINTPPSITSQFTVEKELIKRSCDNRQTMYKKVGDSYLVAESMPGDLITEAQYISTSDLSLKTINVVSKVSLDGFTQLPNNSNSTESQRTCAYTLLTQERK